MSETPSPVGGNVDDLCRACKILRRHTVMALGQYGEIVRVVCDYCGSQHNFRGGEKAAMRVSAPTSPAAERSPLPMSYPESPAGEEQDLEAMLRRVFREESGLTPVVPADKWRGGQLILRPGREGLQEKVMPIDGFFHKIVMLRNRMRTLEQQINASELPDSTKLKLQSYITGCYGSLTSFNVLFADDEDRFHGSK